MEVCVFFSFLRNDWNFEGCWGYDSTRSMVGTDVDDVVGRGDLQVRMLQADAFQIIQ